MRHVILASHGNLARGMADTIGMIVGEVTNLTTYVLERDDMDPISNQVRRELDRYDASDEVFICTDMVGSSVNNDMVGLLGSYPNVTLISGMNLPLVITLVMDEGPATEEEVDEVIIMAAESIKNCSKALRMQAEEAEDDLRSNLYVWAPACFMDRSASRGSSMSAPTASSSWTTPAPTTISRRARLSWPSPRAFA